MDKPELNFDNYCEHCGASLKKYWHKMTPILVSALVKFKKGIYEKQENKIHLINDLKGTANELKPYEWKNWTKLRFHGLVAKYKIDGKWVRGYWLLTKRGNEFLMGDLAIPEEVLTFRNKVVGHSEKLATVADVVGSRPYVEDLFDIKTEIATEDDLLEVPILKKRGKFKKKALCPKCGKILVARIDSEPGEDPNSMKAKKYLVCPDKIGCSYEHEVEI